MGCMVLAPVTGCPFTCLPRMADDARDGEDDEAEEEHDGEGKLN
jgi:hypothetical protein